MYLSCFTHSSTDGHLGCFRILATVNNTALNIGVLMFFLISVLGFFGYISRSGIAGLYGNSVFKFFQEPPKCFLPLSFLLERASISHVERLGFAAS